MRELLRAARAFDRSKCASFFAEPVTDDIAPDYSAIIAHPMDLKTLACAPRPHLWRSTYRVLPLPLGRQLTEVL